MQCNIVSTDTEIKVYILCIKKNNNKQTKTT